MRGKIFILIFLMFIFNTYSAEVKMQDYSSWRVLKEVEQLVKEKYVKPVNDEKKLIYGAIKGMLSTLNDPYTRFIPPKAFKSMKEGLGGKFYGLGIYITQDEDKFIKIISPILGTPASKAGLLPGDKIIAINGKDVRKMTLDEAVSKLKGPKGTTVEITILRKGKRKPFDVVVTRDEIKIKYVGWKYIGKNKEIGYLKITQFVETVPEDVEKALNEFEANKVKGIILDLRGNPGGLLVAAIELARKFIPSGVIVSTKDRFGKKTSYYSFYKTHPIIPMVVLVDSGSASASEILSGALKDHKRAILVGTKTFGKGCVQTLMNLSDGSAIALTTAWYYTPNGVCIHGKGIEPDIHVELPNEILTDDKALEDLRREMEYVMGMTKEALDNEKKYEEKEKDEVKKLPAPWISKWDTQLLTAIDVLKAVILTANKKFDI